MLDHKMPNYHINTFKFSPKTKLSGLKTCPKGPDLTESIVPGSRSTSTARGTYLPPGDAGNLLQCEPFKQIAQKQFLKQELSHFCFYCHASNTLFANIKTSLSCLQPGSKPSRVKQILDYMLLICLISDKTVSSLKSGLKT